MLGFVLGGGAYTFIYAKGASYLTNDPKACINCHVMQEQYDGWIKSSPFEIHHAWHTLSVSVRSSSLGCE